MPWILSWQKLANKNGEPPNEITYEFWCRMFLHFAMFFHRFAYCALGEAAHFGNPPHGETCPVKPPCNFRTPLERGPVSKIPRAHECLWTTTRPEQFHNHA
jgi:hypothetical protein